MRRLLWYGNSSGSDCNPNSSDNPVCLSVQSYGTYCQQTLQMDSVGLLETHGRIGQLCFVLLGQVYAPLLVRYPAKIAVWFVLFQASQRTHRCECRRLETESQSRGFRYIMKWIKASSYPMRITAMNHG
jgi:hypothetical protein